MPSFEVMNRLFLLVFATLIWGLGYVGTRWTLLEYSPTWSNAIRFFFSGVIVLPFLLAKRSQIPIVGAFWSSIVLFIAMQLQTVGIANTTLAKSGFLTVFYAIFTPILTLILFKQRFKLGYWVLLLCSLFGIFLICDMDFNNFNQGDGYILMSALAFAVQILVIDKWAEEVNPLLFNFMQCALVGVWGLGYALLLEGPVSFAPIFDFSTPSNQLVLFGFVILSILSSLIAFTLQIYAQQGMPPHIVSLCFLMESVFAAFFGYYFFQESLSLMAALGCVIVVGSVALIPRYTDFQK